MSKSQGKAKGRRSPDKPKGDPVVNWAERLAMQRRTITDPEQRQAMAVVHKKVLNEFAEWKRMICGMIMRESELELRGDDAEYILPPSLVRRCYETILQQYMNAKRADRNEAIQELRDKLQADNLLVETGVAEAEAVDAKALKLADNDIDADKPRAGFVMEVKR